MRPRDGVIVSFFPPRAEFRVSGTEVKAPKCTMALSLANTNDERVQGELQSIMEDKGWQ